MTVVWNGTMKRPPFGPPLWPPWPEIAKLEMEMLHRFGKFAYDFEQLQIYWHHHQRHLKWSNNRASARLESGNRRPRGMPQHDGRCHERNTLGGRCNAPSGAAGDKHALYCERHRAMRIRAIKVASEERLNAYSRSRPRCTAITAAGTVCEKYARTHRAQYCTKHRNILQRRKRIGRRENAEFLEREAKRKGLYHHRIRDEVELINNERGRIKRRPITFTRYRAMRNGGDNRLLKWAQRRSKRRQGNP